MKKRFSALQELLPLPFSSCFYICAGLFLCGSIAGVFLGMRVQSDAGVVRSLSGMLDAYRSGTYEPGFLSRFGGFLACFLPVFLSALCVPGVVAVPLFSAARGMSLAFTSCVAVRLMGGGILAPLAFVGLGVFLSVPLFLAAASGSLSHGAALTAAVFSRRGDARRGGYFPLFLFVLFTLGLCALFACADRLLAPYFTARLLAAL